MLMRPLLQILLCSDLIAEYHGPHPRVRHETTKPVVERITEVILQRYGSVPYKLHPRNRFVSAQYIMAAPANRFPMLAAVF
jgi:hypothetical protein